VKALTIICIFILLIACFNFVNLATAKSLQRAKEVGVRKTIGASKIHLILQFIGETILLVFISVIISVAVTYSLLPLLNQFTEKKIVFDLFTNPVFAFSLVGLTLLVGVLAGFYPALVLSGFQPIKVLKGPVVSEVTSGRIPWLRHGLVVIQFSLSVLLIISAIVVIRQVNYLHTKDLGFNKEQILFFPMRGENMKKNYSIFKNELSQATGVNAVSVGYGFPGDMFGDGLMTVHGKAGQEPVKATQLMVDEDYIKTLGLQLLAGRDFSKEMQSDKDEAFIINETAVKALGFGTPAKALGQTLLWPTWAKNDSLKKAQVVGVVKDFHFKSLYDVVEPAVLQIYPNAYSKVAVKLKTSEIDVALAHIKKIWSSFSPEYPIEYNFLDESFDQMYKADDKLKSLLSLFTIITIIVACLGLFGLAAYAAERRKKEMGIRKVLGSTVNGIVFLLSKDFLKLVLLALLVASPIAWYFMNQWLQDFAYRINIGWWAFVLAGMLALIIAFITISFQAIKAAVANPVKSLRSE
jgi:putative ABC transport system permease protein